MQEKMKQSTRTVSLTTERAQRQGRPGTIKKRKAVDAVQMWGKRQGLGAQIYVVEFPSDGFYFLSEKNLRSAERRVESERSEREGVQWSSADRRVRK